MEMKLFFWHISGGELLSSMTSSIALCNVFTFQIQSDTVKGHKDKQVAAF